MIPPHNLFILFRFFDDFYFINRQSVKFIYEMVNLGVGGIYLALEGGVFEVGFGGGELFVKGGHI